MEDQAASVNVALAHGLQLLETAPALAAQQAREILASVPGHPAGVLLSGLAASAQRQFAQAVEILRPLVQAQAGSAVAWLALADAHFGLGDDDAADAAYMQHVRLSVHTAELMQAADALAQGDLPEAETRLRARLQRQPTDVAAQRMLAELAARLGRNDEAITLLEQVLQRAPSFDAARQNLATVLNRGNRHAQALVEIDYLLTRAPSSQSLQNMRAVVLGKLGDFDAAITTYECVLAKLPQQWQVWLGYGHALKTANRSSDAITAYRRALALNPGFGGAWWSLANLKTMRFDAADIAAMQVQLQRQDLDDDARLHLEFALGKAQEDAGADAAAFAHYARGNALRRRQLPYDAGMMRVRTQRAMRTYTPEYFAARAGSGSTARDPIFVIGMPRAGSTLIEQILSSHPQVEGTMELPAIIAITRELRQRDGNPETTAYHDVLAGLGHSELHALGEDYLRRCQPQRREGKPFFIDKMPNNFAHAGLIHSILPNAKIIDARRHPLACCFSNFKQHFARGQAFSYDLADMGHYYADYVALMAHFDAVLPGRIHRVLYEDMVANTEAQVRALLDYCELPFDPHCLRFFENTRAVRTASSEQVRQPIYTDGLAQWKRFEPWLGPLKQALGPVLAHYPQVPVVEELPDLR